MKVEIILEGPMKDLRKIIDGIVMYEDRIKVISEKRIK